MEWWTRYPNLVPKYLSFFFFCFLGNVFNGRGKISYVNIPSRNVKYVGWHTKHFNFCLNGFFLFFFFGSFLLVLGSLISETFFPVTLCPQIKLSFIHLSLCLIYFNHKWKRYWINHILHGKRNIYRIWIKIIINNFISQNTKGID